MGGNENDSAQVTAQSHPPWTRLAWIAPVAAVVYVLAQAVAAALLAGTSIAAPRISHVATPGQQMAWALVSAAILVVGLVPLVPRLSGGFVPRWLVLAVFLYSVNAVNNAIEVTIFTRLGGGGYVAALAALPALLCTALLATVRPSGATPSGLVDQPPAHGLAWRLALAWLAFPAAYLTFGAIVSPLVIQSYSAEGGMLVLPPMRVIIGVQAIRSVFFLLPTLAVVERWTGSRLGLWLALGWAHWMLVGLFGLVMPNDFMTPTLRLVHSLEIGADSFAYTGIVVALLARHLSNRAST
jgi:hypothetical protein